MSVLSIFVLLSETDQQNYLHVSMCHIVQKVYKMQSSMKSRILTDSFQDGQRWHSLNDFHDVNDAFSCSL